MLKSAYNKENPNLVFEIEKIDRESLGATGIKEVYVGTLVDTSTDPATTKENYKVQTQGFESDWVSTPGTMGISAALETKSVTITENTTTTITPSEGKDGMSSVEITTDVDIAPQNLEELNVYVKNYYDTILDLPNNYDALYNEEKTLYTSNADYDTYFIYQNSNNKYRVVWNKLQAVYNQWGIALHKYNNDTIFGILAPAIDSNTHMLFWKNSSFEAKRSPEYSTLEECINAIQSNATQYTGVNTTNAAVIDPNKIFYSNAVIYNDETGTFIIPERISSNETIAVIS